MKKKSRVLTKEQIEFRNEVLRIKPKPIKEKPLPTLPKVTTRNEYMNNCMWWINEFEAGRENREHFIKSVTHLRNYCNLIIEENKTLPHDPARQ